MALAIQVYLHEIVAYESYTGIINRANTFGWKPLARGTKPALQTYYNLQ